MEHLVRPRRGIQHKDTGHDPRLYVGKKIGANSLIFPVFFCILRCLVAGSIYFVERKYLTFAPIISLFGVLGFWKYLFLF